MMRGSFLETKLTNFAELFSNGKIYRVPLYQRDYSWTEEEWDDLWQDLIEISSSGQQHYMGSIVVRDGDDGLVIIDGQQRLATLSILVVAALRLIRELEESGVEPEQNRQRFELLFSQFLGMTDPASLRRSSKLILNRNNDAFYHQNLVNFRQPTSVRKLSGSDRQLWDAYRFLYAKLRETFHDAAGNSIAAFLSETVAKGLLFIQIRVSDDLSAYTVFETLNARGLELAPSDLVKNYLFSMVAAGEVDLQHASDRWMHVAGLIEPRHFSSFLRHFLASRKPYVRRERLFKEIKESVRTRDQVFRFLDQLESAALIYNALGDPYDSLWLDYEGARELIRVLRLFGVTQYRPLALAAFEKFTAPEFVRLLRAIVVASLRFNVIGRKGTHQLEQTYNTTAVQVSNGGIANAAAATEKLRSIYIADDEFRNDFSLVEFPQKSDRKLVKYLLGHLESQMTGNELLDFETGEATIEHILPENPGDDWEFGESERDRFTYRLGNMALLEPKLNKRAANLPIRAKAEIYGRSQFALTNALAGREDWTTDAVYARQKELAKIATSIWRI